MKVTDFKIGMPVVILEAPNFWSSGCNKKCPISRLSKMIYPYRCVIKNIIKKDGISTYSMTEGEYGWSLSSLVEENKIMIDIAYQRKMKLKQLNKIK